MAQGIPNGLCPAGHYCPEGSFSPTPCPLGTFFESRGGVAVGSCRRCPAGLFCNATGFAYLFSLLTSAGLLAPVGLCSAGYYCPGGSSSATPFESICPAGFYCPPATSVPVPCQNGTYQTRLGESSCVSCPRGRSCENKANDPEVTVDGLFLI
jgi:hypothetical protein